MNFKKFNPITPKPIINRINKILSNNELSLFVGSENKFSSGGPFVNKMENNFKKYFNTKNAISVNSWSSGLEIAISSLQLEPGDEMIVSPWTMSANVMAIIKNNFIPVFCDIEKDYFNLNPDILETKISKKTRAILTTDIFGHPCNYKKIKNICNKNNLFLISDSAQSIGSKYYEKYTGTFSDIGGFSFNSHKHINSGEGGVLLTNNKRLSVNMKRLRNHAENFQKKSSKKQLNYMVGSNFRLGEIESLIINSQLTKLKSILRSRNKIAYLLNKSLKNISYIKTPTIEKNCTHSFYVYGIIINGNNPKKLRNQVYKEIINSGIDFVFKGYSNIHLLPMFKNKIAYGNKNSLPWSLSKKKYLYKKGDCPIAEDLNDNSFLGIELCKKDLSNKKELNRFIKIIHKSFEKFN